MIEWEKDVPNLQEAFLDVGIVGIQVDSKPSGIPEVLHETVNRLALVIGKVGIVVLDLLELPDICIELIRIDQVLVHVVKVSQDDVSPENELVQGLSPEIERLVAFVEFEEEADPVCRPDTGYLIEKVVDGHQLR